MNFGVEKNHKFSCKIGINCWSKKYVEKLKNSKAQNEKYLVKDLTCSFFSLGKYCVFAGNTWFPEYNFTFASERGFLFAIEKNTPGGICSLRYVFLFNLYIQPISHELCEHKEYARTIVQFY